MSPVIRASAPGKIHFLGEHAVVYGKPAMLTTVNLRCYIEVTPRTDTQIKILSQNPNKTKIHPSDHILLTIKDVFSYYKEKPKTGFNLSVQSEIPIGAGLGSSAATAVATAAAISAFLNKPFDKTAINEIAFRAEQRVHGMPSGGDNSAICFGGLAWFRKETEDLKIIQQLSFTLSANISKNFLIINTGKPEETTGEMVAHVKALYEKNPETVERFLHSQEHLTRELVSAMKNQRENEMITIIKEGEKNLESIGVVSVFAQSIIRDIEKIGGAGKICGGGGVQKGVGVILAYHSNVEKLKIVAKKYNLPYFQAELGVEGVKIVY